MLELILGSPYLGKLSLEASGVTCVCLWLNMEDGICPHASFLFFVWGINILEVYRLSPQRPIM